MSRMVSAPRDTPSWAKAVFDDCARASCSVILPSVPFPAAVALVRPVLVPGSV